MKKFFKWLFIIMIIIIIIIIYARYVGTMGLITKEYTINDSIPSSFDGIKIVHFSDLHYNRAITLNKIESIVDEINEINPDIVVFTGDLIDKDASINSNDYDKLTNVLSKINAKYGKYSIMGNHDVDDLDNIIKVYGDSGFIYLENDYDLIYSNNNDKILISGIGSSSYDKDNIEDGLKIINEDDDIDYKIVLVHEPDIVDNIVNDYHVNLILAGHSHNGQIRLPIIGAIYKPEGAKKYYDEYYQVNDTKLYISSGVGVSTINYRLFNRPSINFYRINKD